MSTVRELMAEMAHGGEPEAIREDWLLVGPDATRGDEGWSFRTRSIQPALLKSPDLPAVLLNDDDLVIPLRKRRRDGPFANVILVGRSDSNDIVIPHSSVSKLHARFTVDGSSPPLLSDAGSSNGTTAEGERIADGERRPLASGNTVAFGSCSFTLLSGVDFGRLLRILVRG